MKSKLIISILSLFLMSFLISSAYAACDIACNPTTGLPVFSAGTAESNTCTISKICSGNYVVGRISDGFETCNWPFVSGTGLCGAGTSCLDGVCVPIADYCNVNADCEIGKVCNLVTHTCDVNSESAVVSAESGDFCSNQKGVCKYSKKLSTQTACDASNYGPDYESTETKCDNLDNDCDGETDEVGCYRTNLLFFVENGEGKFYGCGLTESAQANIGKTFSFMYSNPFDAGEDDINNDAKLCENKGSWYCDKLSSTPLWKSAFQYSSTEKVDTLKVNRYATGGTGFFGTPLYSYFPHGYFNITYARETMPSFTANMYQDYQLCCPNSFCFNGTTCENSADYVNNPKKPPIFMTYGETGLRCSREGTWNIASLKPDYNEEDFGYCTAEDECYAGEGNSCLVSGNWSTKSGKDRMCYNGNWTTRTKYIAAALLNYTKKNNFFEYAIYCDVAERALDSEQSDVQLRENEYFNDYFFDQNTYCDGPCANNFCVLRIGSAEDGQIIVATSLNRELNDTEYPAFRAFGFNASKPGEKKVESYENGETIEKIFESSRSGKLFYSRNKQVIFYTADSSLPNFQSNLFEDIFYFVQNPIDVIVGSVQNIFLDTQTHFIEGLNKYSDFDRLYFAAKGDKEIKGIQERKYNEELEKLDTVVAVEYTEFEANICAAATSRDLICEITSNNKATIYASNPDETFFGSIWQDLTSKIRIN